MRDINSSQLRDHELETIKGVTNDGIAAILVDSVEEIKRKEKG